MQDENSNASEMQVRIVETSTGRILNPDELPPNGQLETWLEMNPG